MSIKKSLLIISVLTLILVFKVLLSSTIHPDLPTSGNGVMFSLVGYDIGGPMRAIIRSDNSNFLDSSSFYEIVGATDGSVRKIGDIFYWGKRWKNYHWWVADFTGFSETGEFNIIIKNSNGVLMLESDVSFKVGNDVLWNDSWHKVAIEQLKVRHAHAIDGIGWRDSGGNLREANSHATMLVGLHDLLDYAGHRLSDTDKNDVRDQIIIGTDYMCDLQDKANQIGYDDGPVVHEIPSHESKIITGDVAKAALVFAMGARNLFSTHQSKASNYLNRAKKAFNYLKDHAPITNQSGYQRLIHGSPSGWDPPVDTEMMTRDLVIMCWAAVELFKVGESAYQADAISLAQRIMDRQIPYDQREDGTYYGHFREYDTQSDPPYSEKAWIHHDFGYDVGGTFPHYFVIPFIQMYHMWTSEPDRDRWKDAVEDFAYHYFKPVCQDNPFYLLPMGYFMNEGILSFAGLWHGMNGAYGSAAAVALELAEFLNDLSFRDIAVGNLQWICGLNASLDDSIMIGDDWVDIPNHSLSGDFTIAAWVKLSGTVGNEDAIVGQEGSGQDINFHAGALRFYAPGDEVIANTVTRPDVWTHCAIKRSGKTLTLYMNGNRDATGSWTGVFTPKAIGRGNMGTNTQGIIDEVYLYSRALSDTEIQEVMNNQTVSSSGLIDHWRFDESTGLKAKDSSGNNNHGWVYGGAQWVAGKYGNGLSFNTSSTFATLYSYSMIVDVGKRSIGSWSGIVGTICNGFDADGQFYIEEPTANHDGPNCFTDEGWITHSGGWCSAISRLNLSSMSSISDNFLDVSVIPKEFVLEQNYPNPFNTETTIQFSVKESCWVVLKVYNNMGREVAILVEGQYMPGRYEVSFDASVLASGLYFYQIQMKDFRAVKKMVVQE